MTMGAYTTAAVDREQYNELVSLIRSGYTDKEGHVHRPNEEVATILCLEANLGCRIGDIVRLSTDSFVKEGGIWRLNITEEKTGKERAFVVPEEVKSYIDFYAFRHGITEGRYFGITCQAVWKHMRAATRHLKLQNVSTHSLRKYGGQRIYENSGYDIMTVAQFYQHASVRTTMKYLKRSPRQLEEAIGRSVSLA